MVDYPTDINLNSGFDVHVGPDGDLVTTSGVAQLEQSVAIDVADEVDDFVSSRITGENIGFLEQAIREGLNDDPQIEAVRSVTITEYDKSTDTISVDVFTVENEEFELEI